MHTFGTHKDRGNVAVFKRNKSGTKVSRAKQPVPEQVITLGDNVSCDFGPGVSVPQLFLNENFLSTIVSSGPGDRVTECEEVESVQSPVTKSCPQFRRMRVNGRKIFAQFASTGLMAVEATRKVATIFVRKASRRGSPAATSAHFH